MKVQITVDEQLWRKAKVSAMMRGQSLGVLVGVALGDLLKNVLLSDGLAAFEEFQKTPVKPLKEERKQPKVKPQTVGGGLVGVEPPKPPVSEFLCKMCGKPTGGAFLCQDCKKG